MSNGKPYLSMVVAARNDNYGGDFIARLKNCSAWFFHYAEKFKIPAEFIVVNYNPLATEKALAEQIDFKPGTFTTVRIITVPNSFHERISADGRRRKLPLYEYVAKNVGIRRARGEYILSANPDILPDPHIFQLIANKQLTPEAYYRTDRCNFEQRGNSIDFENLGTIQRHITTVCAKGKDFDVSFLPGLTLKIGYYKLRSFLFLKYYFFLRRNPWFAKLTNTFVAEEYMCYKLHTNAGGDFLLMHRNNWQNIKGHAENTILPVHVDSITVAAARYSGLNENVLFYPVYHQQHASRFRDKHEDPDVIKMYAKFEADARWMEANKRAIIYNNDAWGFPDEKFDELIITNS